MSKFCTSCDYENIDIASYCAKCGTKFIEVEKQKKTYKTPEEETIKNKKTFLFFSVVFIMFIIGIIFLLNYQKPTTINSNEVSSENYSHSKSYSTDKFSLDVRVTPTNSKIEVLEISQPYYTNMKLEKGNYTIFVSYEGYQPFIKEITLDHNSYITAILKKDRVTPNIIFNREKKNIWECQVEYMIQKNKKYIHPTNENLQKLTIELTNNMDKLHLQSQNGEAIYDYNSFIDVNKGSLGIDYLMGNRFIGVFQNGSIIMGDIDKEIDRKYFCKDMTLDIKREGGNKYSATLINNNRNVIKPIVKKEKKTIEKYILKINTTPINTRIRILNIKPKYHDGIKLKKGKYHIEVSKRGYKTMNRWISLKEDTNLNIELLKNQVYSISQTIEPIIDSIPIYNSPKTSENIEPVTTSHAVKRMSRTKPSMSHLPKETKKVIENSCRMEKYSGGASKYFSCIQTQINILGNRKKPNMSHLPKETKKVIENSCRMEKYSGGASKYFSCIQTQINILGNRKKPNMSHLPKETKKVIENSCRMEKYSGGVSKYFSCIQRQLNQL